MSRLRYGFSFALCEYDRNNLRTDFDIRLPAEVYYIGLRMALVVRRGPPSAGRFFITYP